MSRPEVWKPVVGFPGYEVSDRGRVRSFKRDPEGELLKLHPGGRGYLQLVLRRDGRSHSRLVHRVVLEAFAGPCPPGQETRHLNGDRFDNRRANLAWGTPAENRADAIRHGTSPAARTRCPQGHPDGERKCRTCQRDRERSRHRLVDV
ncbi:NUMOD4 motif-containing protein [Nocardiopsis flavescens]|uniref:NUMOD4 motif-containing protein n=1 Tax=Nocardiopsis flavescens TaxID=758803 RepID=A0A1M6KFW5_9ACTN|nr:NUMOD4 motif-containing HNH endonuclease [Nocardiopsis flavescens]SHJ57885.1 NUMOD4 motif-containing protein [Nocardiopsis flavescens]